MDKATLRIDTGKGAELWKALGERMKERREGMGLTAEALARRMNTGRSMIVKLERGHRRFNAHWLQSAAKALRITSADLLTGLTLDEEARRLLSEPGRRYRSRRVERADTVMAAAAGDKPGRVCDKDRVTIRRGDDLIVVDFDQRTVQVAKVLDEYAA